MAGGTARYWLASSTRAGEGEAVRAAVLVSPRTGGVGAQSGARIDPLQCALAARHGPPRLLLSVLVESPEPVATPDDFTMPLLPLLLAGLALTVQPLLAEDLLGLPAAGDGVDQRNDNVTTWLPKDLEPQEYRWASSLHRLLRSSSAGF